MPSADIRFMKEKEETLRKFWKKNLQCRKFWYNRNGHPMFIRYGSDKAVQILSKGGYGLCFFTRPVPERVIFFARKRQENRML